MSMIRSRWAALGAAVAVTLGGGGIGLVGATVESGEKPVFVAMTPCRLMDTRPGPQVGPRGTPLGTAETHTVAAHGTNGDCTIPDDALALSMNMTAIGATLPTFLTVWATDEPMPDASSLNPVPGQPPTPNAVVTELSDGGQFDIYNLQGEVHVIADVNGYYADHTHDDRYVLARDGYVRLTSFEMRPTEEGTNWSISMGWEHDPTSKNPECIYGRVDVPIGRDITAMSVTYAAPAGDADLTVVLFAAHATPGSTMTGLPPIAVLNDTAPQTAPFELAALPIPVSSPTEVLEDYSYVASVCTKDLVEIVAADVTID